MKNEKQQSMICPQCYNNQYVILQGEEHFCNCGYKMTERSENLINPKSVELESLEITEPLKHHCHMFFGMGGPDYSEIQPHFNAGADCQKNHFIQVIKDRIEELEKSIRITDSRIAEFRLIEAKYFLNLLQS